MLLGSALFCFKFFFQEGHRLSPVGGVGGRQTSFLAPKQGQSRELAWAVETIGGGSNAFTIQHITRTRFIILPLQLQFNTTTPPLPPPPPPQYGKCRQLQDIFLLSALYSCAERSGAATGVSFSPLPGSDRPQLSQTLTSSITSNFEGIDCFATLYCQLLSITFASDEHLSTMSL